MSKVIIISGLSKGLGLGIAKKLYKIIGKLQGSVEKTPNIAYLKKNLKIIFYRSINIKDYKKFDEFIDNSKKMGKIFGLINNAGTVNENLLVNQDINEIKNLLEINLLGPILLTKKVIKFMMINNSGRIINISSIVAKSGYKVANTHQPKVGLKA